MIVFNTERYKYSGLKYLYECGNFPPNYPVPAIPIRVGYMPAHPSQPYPSAYWYICSDNMLWSCFERFGLVIETR